jgi:hypothetical protein
MFLYITFFPNKDDGRKLRGMEIAKASIPQISRIDQYTYKVLSQNGNGEYAVCLSENEWRCECPDHRFRAVKCKHIWAVEYSVFYAETVTKLLL